MCIKKPVIHFSENCTCAIEEKLSVGFYISEESSMSSQHDSKVFGV